jgi:ankyrin repeat protein
MGRMTDDLDPELIELAHRLFDLARTGGTDELVAYVDRGVPVNLTEGNAGNTLLMLAAYHGHTGTVEALVARGADVDRLNDRGQSPLAGAIFKGENDIVRLLVQAGADPDVGSPSARATAEMFERAHLLDLP